MINTASVRMIDDTQVPKKKHMVMNQKINNYYKLYIMQYERIFKLTFATIAINHYRFKCSRNDSQNFKHLKSDKKKNCWLELPQLVNCADSFCSTEEM